MILTLQIAVTRRFGLDVTSVGRRPGVAAWTQMDNTAPFAVPSRQMSSGEISSQLLRRFLEEARQLWARGDRSGATERCAKVFLAEGLGLFEAADQPLLDATLERLKPPVGFDSWQAWLASDAAKAKRDSRTDDEVVADLLRKRGRTPLHEAAERGELAEVERLLTSGAEPDAIFENGTLRWTPLCAAVLRDHFEVVQRLLAAGANPQVSGATPAIHGVKSVAVARLLLDAGADLSVEDQHKRFPLARVVDTRGSLELARFLASKMPPPTVAQRETLQRIARQSTPQLRAFCEELISQTP